MAATKWSESLSVEVPYLPLSEIEPEPLSYKEAMESVYREGWKDAMSRELRGLISTNTFVDVPKPADRKAISSRWVYRWKLDNSGHVVKAKARLVAKGYSQV